MVVWNEFFFFELFFYRQECLVPFWDIEKKVFFYFFFNCPKKRWKKKVCDGPVSHTAHLRILSPCKGRWYNLIVHTIFFYLFLGAIAPNRKKLFFLYPKRALGTLVYRKTVQKKKFVSNNKSPNGVKKTVPKKVSMHMPKKKLPFCIFIFYFFFSYTYSLFFVSTKTNPVLLYKKQNIFF
jgi:hypothetical protein